MPWNVAGRDLPLFERDRIGSDFPAEERVSEQVAAVLDRIEPDAVEALLARLAERGGVPGWVPAKPLTLRCEVVRARPEAAEGSRRLDLAWLHDDARIVFAIEVKVQQIAWALGGPEREKFRDYAAAVRRETQEGARLLALTPYALPASELADAKRVLPSGAVVWATFCDTLRDIAAAGARCDDAQRPRWPVAAVLLPELARLLGPGGLDLDFTLAEADMDALTTYSSSLDTVLKVRDAVDSLGARLAAELAALGLRRDEDSEGEDLAHRLRSPYWSFDPAEPEACAEGFLVAVGLRLDRLDAWCFVGFWGEPHSEAATATLAGSGLRLAWWGRGEERPRLDVPPAEWATLVSGAGESDWWGTASVRPLAKVLPEGIAADAPLVIARWVGEELRRVGPQVTQADVWPAMREWPTQWRMGQLAGHADFHPCPTCPVDDDLSRPCAGEPALGWGPVACQAYLARAFTDDDGRLRLRTPAAGSAWEGSPQSDGLYARGCQPHCCGVELPAIGMKRSLTCTTCGRRHERAAVLGASRGR